MGTINPALFFGTTRLFVKFIDDLGNKVDISGTCFNLILTNGNNFLVTNKHNIDPSMKLGKDTKYKISELKIQLRKIENSAYTSKVEFFQVDLSTTKIVNSETADVSLIVLPKYMADTSQFGLHGINATDKNIADEEFFEAKVTAFDSASFIGVPGTEKSKWWDLDLEAPISRTVNIASLPNIPFSNPSILTTDVTVVSGLSFTGSSGSPIFIHEKGIAPGGDIHDSGYVAPKLIGLMSGHWWEKGLEPEMFYHTGLSYFTRSTSILELMKKI